MPPHPFAALLMLREFALFLEAEKLTNAALGAPNITANPPLQDVYQDLVYGYDGSGNPVSSLADLSGWGAGYDGANELGSQGRAGPVQVAGYINEPAAVTVNGLPAVVTINGSVTRQWAMSGGTNFAFENELLLSSGSNNVTVAATDANSHTRTNVYTVQAGGYAANFTYDDNGRRWAMELRL